MRVLLSTIGTRGEVQPVLGLALELRGLGQEVRVCAPPDFRELVESYDLPFAPVGPEVRAAAGTKRSRESLLPGIPETVADQFAKIGAAAEDCDMLVGAGALQIAARSIAESRRIPYFYAAYCPITLPSAHHAPPPFPGRDTTASIADQWEEDRASFNALFGAPLNEGRLALGLPPVPEVRDHIFTGRPILASDPALTPWPMPSALAVAQTGAWLVRDDRPLPDELEAFLADGEPPIYFGFGSRVAPRAGSQAVVDAARALGRRAIVLSGWADLSTVDDGADCLAIGEVNQQALFPRVAAVVHHGGAGTTHAVARAGVPHVVIPSGFDQFYHAQRVCDLGIGVGHPAGEATADSLADALKLALQPDVAARARAFAGQVRTDGASAAARQILG